MFLKNGWTHAALVKHTTEEASPFTEVSFPFSLSLFPDELDCQGVPVHSEAPTSNLYSETRTCGYSIEPHTTEGDSTD